MGVGAAYGRPDDAQSAYLVRVDGRAVCLDLGAGTLNRLAGMVAPEALEAVVISHVHPDHCADLLALRVYMAWGPGRGRRVRVLGPAGLRERLIAFSGPEGWDEGILFEVLDEPRGRLDLGGGLVLTYAEVPHLPPTFALRLDHGDRSICFGADCAPNDALVELASGCGVLLAECSFGAMAVPEGVPHLNAIDAGVIAGKARATHLLLTHCYPELDRDQALAAALEAAGIATGWATPGVAVAA